MKDSLTADLSANDKNPSGFSSNANKYKNHYIDLQDLEKYCSISAEDLLSKIDDMKNQEILEQHPYAISQGTDGRYRTYLPDESKPSGRKMIAKASQEAVHKAVIVDYKKRMDEKDNSNLNLENIYKRWLMWRREIGTEPNTIKRYADDWKSYVQDSSLSKRKLKDIEIRDLKNYFLKVTQNYAITQKAFTNIKTLLNGIYKFAVEESLGGIDRNILQDIDCKQFRNRCRPSGSGGGMYSENEKRAILEYLEDKTDIYSLAISFSFRMCMRISELVAIKKTDILEDSLLVERSKRRKQYLQDDFTFTMPEYVIEDRIKGNKVKGGRKINLPTKARETALKAMELYPEGEYLFMNKGKPIVGSAFNRYLKLACEKLNIKYLPSHQIRFTNATALVEAGVKINQLSHDLIHAHVSTTYSYIRQNEMDKESRALASQVLNL